MPVPLNTGAVTSALTKAFGLKGRYNPALDEIVVPVYVISDPAPAASEAICLGHVMFTNAANPLTTAVMLRNPPSSGKLLLVSALEVTMPGLTPSPGGEDRIVQWAFLGNPATTNPLVGQSQFRDQRALIELSPPFPVPSAEVVGFNRIPHAEANIISRALISIESSHQIGGGGGYMGMRESLMVLPPGRAIVGCIVDEDGVTAIADGEIAIFNAAWHEIGLDQTTGGIPPLST